LFASKMDPILWKTEIDPTAQKGEDDEMEAEFPNEKKVKVAIIGSGNIGSDLMYKLLKQPGHMELVLLTGIDPASEGLARARALGIRASDQGIDAVLADPEIRLVFDATSAKAHVRHAKALREAGKIAIDLTPAARGPYVVPPANLKEHLDKMNVNMVTCGGQATAPLVYAAQRATPLAYAEMVSTVASLSAGPGTRQNIDEFTETTARALEVIGGAKQGKAIIILNPADPPIMMRNTVYALPEGDFDEAALTASIEQMEAEVQTYVPGYHLKNPPVVDLRDTPWGKRPVITMLLEVEGAGDYLPRHAGNLDIMTASARRVGEMFARRLLGIQEEVAV
jgi:acetaldehyde dehydrogenase